MGYIQRYWTGPPILASVVKCMTKCTITMKKDGGNIFSNSHNVTAISTSAFTISETVRVLEQIFLKKQANFIKGPVTCDGKDPCKAIGRSCYIKMWLSWLFKPKILCSFRLTRREMLEAYPSGTLTSRKAYKKPSFSNAIIWKHAGGIVYLSSLFRRKWSSLLIPMSAKSRRACNYPLPSPSSSTPCQVYCPSHSSLYAWHQNCVATYDAPNKTSRKIYFSSSKHTGLPYLSFFCCKEVDISSQTTSN